MTLDDLIKILENKLMHLAQLKTTATSIGDVEQIVKIEQEHAATSTLISQIKQVSYAT